jgi:hypothetical protein
MKRYIHIILALVVVVGLLSVQAQNDITSEDQVEPSPGTFAARLDEYNRTTSNGALNSSSFGKEKSKNNYSYITLGNTTSEKKDVVDVEDDEGLYSMGLDGTNYLSSGSNSNTEDVVNNTIGSLPASLSGKSGFTVNIWVKPTSALYANTTGHHFNSFISSFTDKGPIMSWLKSDNVKGWFLGMNKDKEFVYGIAVPGSDGIVKIVSEKDVANQHQWYMLTATYTPITGRATLYVNGQRTASKKLIFPNQPRNIDYGTSESSLPELNIMRYNDRSSDIRSKGAVGDIAIWDRSLAVSEVRKLAISRRKSAGRLYRQISKPISLDLDNSDAPTLYFSFKEGQGMTVEDAGPRKLALHVQGINPPTWIGDLSSKMKASGKGVKKHQTTQQKIEEERDAVKDQMPERLAKDIDVKTRMNEIKQSHNAAIKLHVADNEMKNKVAIAEQNVADKNEIVEKLGAARSARTELLNRINMHIAHKGGNSKITRTSKIIDSRIKATKALDNTEKLYAAAKISQREALKEKAEVKKAMQEMKFDGSLQAAGYSILHKTVEILGRMTKKHDITINMLREQLESSTMEAESESRTAELNRQNDWRECHVIDIQAKEHVGKTMKQLKNARSRSDMAARASSDAHEQRDNNNAQISRLQSYLSHVENQLKRVRTIASVKKVPSATERRAEKLLHTMNDVLGEVVDHEAPYDKKVVPKPGQVLDESHLINTDRDWVDRVDWDTKQNRASMLLETSSERKPWEHVIEETRWGTGKELLGSEPDPLKTVNVTENAANATDPEFLREQVLAKMLSDKDEAESLKPKDICLTCRDEDDHAMLYDLFQWSTPEPKIKKPIQDPEFNETEYSKTLDTLEPVGKYDNDKKWLPAKAKAEELHGVIKKLGSMWAGTASMEHPSAFFTFDIAHMQATAKKALDLAKSRQERLEMLVSASEASAARAEATANDLNRLLESQTRFYNNYHIRCEAKADIYAAMADKRSRALDAIATVENLFAEETAVSGNGKSLAVIKNETQLQRVMGHLQELMTPPKAYKELAPRPWKHLVKKKKDEPMECAYQVKAGDYLMAIADKFGIESASLISANAQEFKNNTMYPKTKTWLTIPVPKRNTEGCKMSPEGFAQSVKYMEPLSKHGFPISTKNTKNLTKSDVKLLILAKRNDEITLLINNQTASLHNKEHAMEQMEYLAGDDKKEEGQHGDDVGKADQEVLGESLTALSKLNGVNFTSMKSLKNLIKKVVAVPKFLEKLAGNITIEKDDVKDLIGNNVIDGKEVLPPSLVEDVRRRSEHAERNLSVTLRQKMAFANKINSHGMKVLERVMAKYLKVYPDQVKADTLNGAFIVNGLNRGGVKRLRKSVVGMKVKNITNALQSVGLTVLSMEKPIVSNVLKSESNEEARSPEQSNRMVKLLKHVSADLQAKVKLLMKALTQSLKAAIARQKARIAKLERLVNDENKQLQAAENSFAKKNNSRTSKRSSLKRTQRKSKNVRDAVRRAMHLSRQMKLKAQRARARAAAIRAAHLKEESKKAALKAKALDREEKKLKLRLAKEHKRRLLREKRVRDRMAKMKKMLELAKKNRAQKKAAQSRILQLKNDMIKESREDAKQEANLNLKVLIVDAAEKCELAKQKRGVMEIAMCKTAVQMTKRKATETRDEVGLTAEMKKMVASMPSGMIEAKKPKVVTTPKAAPAVAAPIVAPAPKPSLYKNPGFASFKGTEYVDLGFKGFQAMHLKSSEQISIEAWVKVHNAAADKFAAVVSAVGENKFNPVNKKNDGNGPYKKGFVLGYGPSQDDSQTNPVWAFGIKGESGFNPKLSYVRSQSSVKLSTWTHLAATYDGKVARLYVNGAVEAISSSGEQTGKIDFGSNFPTKPKLMLMAYGVNGEVPASPCCVEADLSDTAIWSRTLNDKEVSNHAALYSRTLEDANAAANARDGALTAFWQLSTRSVQMVNDGEMLQDRTHTGLAGQVIEGGGVAAPLTIQPSKKKVPVALTKEEIENTDNALDKSKLDENNVAEAKRLLNERQVDDAQKALLLEAVISGLPTDKLKKISVTKATEAVDSKYRSRVISVVGGSKKFQESRKKTAILALVSAESKADIGKILEALLNGRKIEVPGLEKNPALKDAKSGMASLPKNVRSLLKSLKESAEQEIRGKLTGQALAAKKRATALYNKQKATLEGIQSQLKRNIKNVAVAQQTAEMKKQAADTEMKHAVALAKEAARTNAQVKQHLESKGFSMPSLTFEQEVRDSKAKMAKKDKKTMIDQTKELAAMAAKRATRAALLDAQAALKAAKTKFEESRSDCVNNAQNEKKCKDISDAVTKASSDVLRKQERYNRAEQMLAKYKSSLSNDMTEFTKQRQAFFKEHEKMQDHLESEIQRLTTIAAQAKQRKEQAKVDNKVEEAAAFEHMESDARKSASKAAMELASRQVKFDHYNGKSAIFTSTLDKSQLSFESPTHEKWSREQEIKFSDHELQGCVHNTSLAREKVKKLGEKVSKIGADLAEPSLTGQMKEMLRGNLNLAASQYKSAQSELEKALAAELIARAKLMELSGQFFEFQKDMKSGDKQLTRVKAELEAARNSGSFEKMQKEKAEHVAEEKSKLVSEGIKTINGLAQGLNNVTEDKSNMEKTIKGLETEIKKSNLQHNERMFVRGAIRIEGTKESFAQADQNGTVKQTVFIDAIATLVGEKKENIQITDVSDATLSKETTVKTSIRRRRLLGNIRGIMPTASSPSSPLVDIRFRIFTTNPKSVAEVLKSKMPVFASDYGFANSVLLQNNVVLNDDASSSPLPKDGPAMHTSSATGTSATTAAQKVN